MINKNEILNLYYIEKYKQVEIVEKLNISKSTINRIIKADERYIKEKERRQQENKLKNKKKTIEYINLKRQVEKNTTIYERLKKEHINASRELSGGSVPISNRAFRNWNPSIYKYEEKSKSYVLKKGIIVGADVPKRINWKGL